jgi:hypothetical protein
MLVNVIYGQENDLSAKVVETDSDLFKELIKEQNIQKIFVATDESEKGSVRRAILINYYENNNKKNKILIYKVIKGHLEIQDLNGFSINGFKIKKVKREYGELLGLELVDNEIVPQGTKDSNKLIYAIKVLRKANIKLIEALKEKKEDNVSTMTEQENSKNEMDKKIKEEVIKKTEKKDSTIVAATKNSYNPIY